MAEPMRSESSSAQGSSSRSSTPWWRRRQFQFQRKNSSNLTKHFTLSSSANRLGFSHSRSRFLPRFNSTHWWLGSEGSDLEVFAQQALLRARSAASALRWRVSGPPLLLGLLMLSIVASAYFVQIGGGTFIVRRSTYGIFMFAGVICLGLTVLPTDEKLIRALAVLACPAFIVISVLNLQVAIANTRKPDKASCGISKVPQICSLDWLVAALTYALCALALLPVIKPTTRICGRRSTASSIRIQSFFKMPPRAALARLWTVARAMCIAIGILNLYHCTLHATIEAEYVRGCSVVASSRTCNVADAGAFAQDMVASLVILLCGLLPTHGVRLRIHSYLASRLREGEARQAAIVAHLVGQHGSRHAFKSGVASFRGLPFSAISADDLTTSRDTGLFNRTVKCKLGGVDAFISHSWQDSGESKWALLTRWAERFELVHGREPIVWLDKGCIDQQAIDESLMNLPVYLAGCRELLVLAGPTYHSRLWCVMEMLVFLRMGGLTSRITVLPVPGRSDGKSPDDFSDLAFSNFDARNASCFHAEDKSRLLGVMEAAGLGGLAAFNLLVRKAFTEAVNRLELNEAVREILWSAAISVRGSRSSASARHAHSVRASQPRVTTPIHSLPPSQRRSRGQSLHSMPESESNSPGQSPVHALVDSQRPSCACTTPATTRPRHSCGATGGGILSRLSISFSRQPTVEDDQPPHHNVSVGPHRFSARSGNDVVEGATEMV